MLWFLTWLVALVYSNQPELSEFKAVEYEFNRTVDTSQKCSIPLSSITYAFAIMETGNGAKWQMNLFWLKGWWARWGKAPMFNSYTEQKRTSWGYRIYYSRKDAIYDFMSNFYYVKWCNLTLNTVHTHLRWPSWWWDWVKEYYNWVIKMANRYSKLDIYIKKWTMFPKTQKEYDTTIESLISWWFTLDWEELEYENGIKITIDTEYNKYTIRENVLKKK